MYVRLAIPNHRSLTNVVRTSDTFEKNFGTIHKFIEHFNKISELGSKQHTVEHTYEACPKYSELGSYRIIGS